MQEETYIIHVQTFRDNNKFYYKIAPYDAMQAWESWIMRQQHRGFYHDEMKTLKRSKRLNIYYKPTPYREIKWSKFRRMCKTYK